MEVERETWKSYRKDKNVRLTARLGPRLFRKREELRRGAEEGKEKQRSLLLCFPGLLLLPSRSRGPELYAGPPKWGLWLKGTLPTTQSAPELSSTKPDNLPIRDFF